MPGIEIANSMRGFSEIDVMIGTFGSMTSLAWSTRQLRMNCDHGKRVRSNGEMTGRHLLSEGAMESLARSTLQHAPAYTKRLASQVRFSSIELQYGRTKLVV